MQAAVGSCSRMHARLCSSPLHGSNRCLGGPKWFRFIHGVVRLWASFGLAEGEFISATSIKEPTMDAVCR